MKVLVCGGRDYNEPAIVSGRLDRLHRNYPISAVIQGGASGADSCAAAWATKNNVQCITFHADWKSQGKAAGPIRNKRMLNEGKPELVVAFYGGRGTADMVNQAKAAGVTVLDLLEEAEHYATMLRVALGIDAAMTQGKL